MRDIVIIGGGASGMLCACAIKEHDNGTCNVTILERCEKVGKKILATGNGKCNFTNKNLVASKYNNPEFVKHILKDYGNVELINYFETIGLLSRELTQGRIYPFSETASQMNDVLKLHMQTLGVNVRTNCEVNNIAYKNGKYYIYNKSDRNVPMQADTIIFACGGCSAPILGSNGSGFNLLKPWKVDITSLQPGLVGLKVNDSFIKSLSGIRIKAVVNLIEKKSKKNVFSEKGEVQFKKDGISGICVMQAASFLTRFKKNTELELDLMPDLNEFDLNVLLTTRRNLFLGMDLNKFFIGMFPKMIGSAILRKANLDLSGYCDDLKPHEISKLTASIKHFTLNVKGDYGFENSQVTVGGISTNEVDPVTLRIKKMEDAYAIGEMLDIDGDCGGYNLSWAFASGYNVGKNIATETAKEVEWENK